MSAYADALISIFTSEQKYTVLQLIKALINAVEELAGHTVVDVSVSQTTPHQGEPTTVTLTLSFDDDTTTNLTFTVPAGVQGIQGATGPQGEQGIGIRSCNIEQYSDDRFAIEFTLDDNTVIGTGWITLPEGPQGPQGPQGLQGPAGADGMTIVEASGTFNTDRDAIIAAWPKVIYRTPSNSNLYYYPSSYASSKYLMYRITIGDNGRIELDYIEFRATDSSYTETIKSFAGNINISQNANNSNIAPSCLSIVTYVTALLASYAQLPANFAQGDMLVGDSQGGLVRLQHGTTGQVLGADQNGLPEWQTPSGGGGTQLYLHKVVGNTSDEDYLDIVSASQTSITTNLGIMNSKPLSCWFGEGDGYIIGECMLSYDSTNDVVIIRCMNSSGSFVDVSSRFSLITSDTVTPL